MNRTLRACLATAVAVGLLASAQAVATEPVYDNIVPYGTKIGDCFSTGLCKADNRTHTVYTKSLGPRYNAAVFQTLGLSYATTDLDIQYPKSPTSTTDVIYQYGNLPGSALGTAECIKPINRYSCDQFIVIFDSDQACAFGCSDRFLRAVACHETGHTVGLLHGDHALPPVSNTLASLACMRTPVDLTANPYLGSHNAAQINFSY